MDYSGKCLSDSLSHLISHKNCCSCSLSCTCKPKKKKKKLRRPRRKITKCGPDKSCPTRIEEISLPLQRRVDFTLQRYGSTLGPEMVLNMCRLLHELRYPQPKAVNYFEPQKTMKIPQRKRQKTKEKQGSRWMTQQAFASSIILESFVQGLRDFIPTYKLLQVSAKLFTSLNLRNVESKNKYLPAELKSICDKLAVFIDDKLEPYKQELITDAASVLSQEDKHCVFNIFDYESETELVELSEGEEEEALEKLEGETPNYPSPVSSVREESLIEEEEEMVQEAEMMEDEGEEEIDVFESESNVIGEESDESEVSSLIEQQEEEEDHVEEGEVEEEEEEAEEESSKVEGGEEQAEEEQTEGEEMPSLMEEEVAPVEKHEEEEEVEEESVMEGVVEEEMVEEEEEEEEEEKLVSEEKVSEQESIQEVGLDEHPKDTSSYIDWCLYVSWLKEFGNTMEMYAMCLQQFRFVLNREDTGKDAEALQFFLHHWCDYLAESRNIDAQMTEYFKDKPITVCTSCRDSTIDDYPEDHYIPPELEAAIKTTKHWRKLFLEAEEYCRQLCAEEEEESEAKSEGEKEFYEIFDVSSSSSSSYVIEQLLPPKGFRS